jgi:hypothetical protein
MRIYSLLLSHQQLVTAGDKVETCSTKSTYTALFIFSFSVATGIKNLAPSGAKNEPSDEILVVSEIFFMPFTSHKNCKYYDTGIIKLFFK